MKSTIKLICFIIYVLTIFFIKEYCYIILAMLINLIIITMNLKKVRITLKMILQIGPFILFIVLVNWLFADFKVGVLIGIRLILVCSITYVFSQKFTGKELSEALENMFAPLKLFKINNKDIILIISIGITFIPIFKTELKQAKEVLKVKGVKTNAINMIKNSKMVLESFFISIIQRVNEIEESLKAKGYQE